MLRFWAFTGMFVGVNGTHDLLKSQGAESNGLNFEGMFASSSQWNYISHFRPIAFFMPALNKLKRRRCFHFPHLYVNRRATMKYLAAEKKRGPPLVNFTQLQTHIHLSRSWYGLMYISVSVHKSRCQSQLLLSVSFLWKYNSYLSRSHRLSCSSTLFFSFFF